MRRRKIHDHRINPLEQPQRHRLIGDAVLRADDRHRIAGGVAQIGECGARLLRLHAQQHDVAFAPVEFRGVAVRCNGERVFTVGRDQPQTVLTQCGEMGTAGDQRHCFALLEQSRADRAADAAGAVDDESHRAHCVPNLRLIKREPKLQCRAAKRQNVDLDARTCDSNRVERHVAGNAVGHRADSRRVCADQYAA